MNAKALSRYNAFSGRLKYWEQHEVNRPRGGCSVDKAPDSQWINAGSKQKRRKYSFITVHYSTHSTGILETQHLLITVHLCIQLLFFLHFKFKTSKFPKFLQLFLFFFMYTFQIVNKSTYLVVLSIICAYI